jgi:hypothetical protein
MPNTAILGSLKPDFRESCTPIHIDKVGNIGDVEVVGQKIDAWNLEAH